MTGGRFLEYIDPKERNVWCKPSDMIFHILIIKTLKKETKDFMLLSTYIRKYFWSKKLEFSFYIKNLLATSAITTGFTTKHLSLKCLAPYKTKRK